MLRALIIEDEPVNRRFLLLALGPHATCEAAATAEDGLATFRRALDDGEPYGLVLLDLKLPGMDGLKCLEHLRALEDERELPSPLRAQVVVTTVLDDDQAASRAFVQGQAASYMVKPFQAGQLLAELSKLGLIA